MRPDRRTARWLGAAAALALLAPGLTTMGAQAATDVEYVTYPSLPAFDETGWLLPPTTESMSWHEDADGNAVVTAAPGFVFSFPDTFYPGREVTQVSYGPVPTSETGSVHFTDITACTPPAGGGSWGHLVAQWNRGQTLEGTDISYALRDGTFHSVPPLWPSGFSMPGLIPIDIYGPEFTGTTDWLDLEPSAGPVTWRAVDQATGEVIGQRVFDQYCGVDFDPIEEGAVAVPPVPAVDAEGQWVVPEWDETFQWVVLMDGTLQVRLLPAWSTFPDGQVTHNYGLPEDTTPDPAPTVDRVRGSDRYATAASLVLAEYAPGLDTVYLASGLKFPDALSAAALAGAQDAPVLLTAPGNLPDATRTALQTLAPQHVVVLGGTAAVAQDVLDEVTALGLDVTRVSGSDRFATAAAVSARLAPADTVFVASGLNYPDALAAGALAGHLAAPVLLTRHDTLPDAAVAELQRHQPGTVHVLGGTAAVSHTVVDQIEDLGFTVVRVGGTDRYATAAAVAALHGEAGFPHAWVASGTGFPDALSAAPLAGREGGAVLLTAPRSLPTTTADALIAGNPTSVTVLGGEAAISNDVQDAITALHWE